MAGEIQKIVAGRSEPECLELSRDECGGDVCPGGARRATAEQIAGQEPKVGAHYDGVGSAERPAEC